MQKILINTIAGALPVTLLAVELLHGYAHEGDMLVHHALEALKPLEISADKPVHTPEADYQTDFIRTVSGAMATTVSQPVQFIFPSIK